MSRRYFYGKLQYYERVAKAGMESKNEGGMRE